MQDTRLTQAQLDAAVDFAYGGGAYRAGRRSQAQTISSLLRGCTRTPTTTTVARRAKA